MDPMPSVEEMKSLVFGLGRGVGVRIFPRHYRGDYATQMRDLARDVLNAPKSPLDDASDSTLNSANNLARLLDVEADVQLIADGLEKYIRSRAQWVGRDAVE